MSVYVDNGRIRYRRMLMCHMIADTLAELHEMADRIGVKRKWFQEGKALPHYDICQSKRALALKYGSLIIDRKQLVERIRKHRLQKPQ